MADWTAESRADWLEALGDDDQQFLKRFLLSSGSLKAMAEEYGVSYPTVRARLDRMIAKVRISDETKTSSPFERTLRLLVAEGQLSASIARQLLDAHKTSMTGGEGS